MDDGSPVTSSSITVSNTAPTAPSVSILPNEATAGQDDLVCSIDTSSSDDDEIRSYIPMCGLMILERYNKRQQSLLQHLIHSWAPVPVKVRGHAK